MKDRFGREIDYLRVSVTDNCNLRCVYCMDEKDNKFLKKDEKLTDDEIYRVVKESAKLGIKKVRITGGEPLVRPGVVDLIGKINSIDGIEEIYLTTNGILLADRLDELVKNGLKGVNISLDSLKEDRFNKLTRLGHVDNVLAAIDKAISLGIKVKLNTVIVNDINKDDIIFKYNYDFNKSLSTEYKVKNTYPKIIILEGLYSFNLFSDNKFDLTKLNPYKSALEYDDVPLELNDASLRNQFITLKIMLTMNKDDIKNILLYRNANYRNSDDVTHNFNTILINKFNHYIWPATEKWGLLGKKEADVIIVGGTRNKKDIKIVTNAILTPFNYKDQLITFEKFIDH